MNLRKSLDFSQTGKIIYSVGSASVIYHVTKGANFLQRKNKDLVITTTEGRSIPFPGFFSSAPGFDSSVFIVSGGSVLPADGKLTAGLQKDVCLASIAKVHSIFGLSPNGKDEDSEYAASPAMQDTTAANKAGKSAPVKPSSMFSTIQTGTCTTASRPAKELYPVSACCAPKVVLSSALPKWIAKKLAGATPQTVASHHALRRKYPVATSTGKTATRHQFVKPMEEERAVMHN